MRLGMSIVTLVCLACLGELVYFNKNDWMVIILSLFAFVPYICMTVGIMVNKRISKALLGEEN